MNNKGATLLEVMAVLLLSSILMLGILSPLISISNINNRIQDNSQLISEANQLTIAIFQTINDFHVEEVESCGSNCLTLIHKSSIDYTDGVVTETENPEYLTIRIDGSGKFSIDQTVSLDSSTSSITLKCDIVNESPCRAGVIEFIFTFVGNDSETYDFVTYYAYWGDTNEKK